MKHTLHPKHKIPRTSAIDSLALLIGIIQPLTTIPQIYLVYTSKDVASISFFMWTSYNVASVILLLYGIKHKLPPIIWAQSLWIIVQTPMMVAVLLFR
ncbi:TPA: hypothetical protein DD425_00200 [Candidatus Saccharibacteria bacterium]|nr:hypothetical protein [Candidatus Saccharibacteria bacterium]|tara:strand:- start:3247 stop:3540 length:294 start_codon:yes stop_codon:yes gene_type:complete